MLNQPQKLMYHVLPDCLSAHNGGNILLARLQCLLTVCYDAQQQCDMHEHIRCPVTTLCPAWAQAVSAVLLLWLCCHSTDEACWHCATQLMRQQVSPDSYDGFIELTSFAAVTSPCKVVQHLPTKVSSTITSANSV